MDRRQLRGGRVVTMASDNVRSPIGLRQHSQRAPNTTGARSERPKACGTFWPPSRAHSYQASTTTSARRCRNAGTNSFDVATVSHRALIGLILAVSGCLSHEASKPQVIGTSTCRPRSRSQATAETRAVGATFHDGAGGSRHKLVAPNIRAINSAGKACENRPHIPSSDRPCSAALLSPPPRTATTVADRPD